MKKNIIYIFCLLLAITSFNTINAQVTIGIGEVAEKGALLDLKESQVQSPTSISALKNAQKGLLFPRVQLVGSKSLSPLYSGTPSAEEMLLATGMVVYNVNEDLGDMDPGLYVWNSEEWVSLMGGGTSNSVVEIADCDKIEIKGTYEVGQGLDMTQNTIKIPVKVNKKGNYSITVMPKVSNGYYFCANGDFLETGIFDVTLSGMGTPLKKVTDELIIKINGQEVTACSPQSLVISGMSADYTLDCSRTTAPAGLLEGQVTGSSDVIKVYINTNSSKGAAYSIQTDEVNGVSFSAVGVLSGTAEYVTLYAKGTPTAPGSFTYQITTNSKNTSAKCSIVIPVKKKVGRVISVGIFSKTGDSHGLYGNDRTVTQLLKNTSLFGPNGKLATVESVNLKDGGTDNSKARTMMSGMNPVDIMIIGYKFKIDAATVSQMIQYVNNGGVVIFTVDDDCDVKKTKSLIDGLLGSSVTLKSETGDNVMKLLSGTPVVDGNINGISSTNQYQLSGKGVGRDSGSNIYITNLPTSKAQVIVNSSKGTRGFKMKDKGFFFFGDRGFFSGGNNSTAIKSSSHYPALADGNNMPLTKSTGNYAAKYGGPAYNAHLLYNILAWSVQYSLEKRPDGGAILP